MRRDGFNLPLALTPLLLAGVVGNVLLLYALIERERSQAIVLGLVPLALVVFGALVAQDRSILVFGALGLTLTVSPLNQSIPSLGGLHPSDVLVALAVGSWLGSWFLGRDDRPVQLPRSPLIGWPLLVLAVVLLVALVRGYENYDAPLGQPIRLIVYSLIALSLVAVDPRRIYRGVVAVFYAGTVWMFLNAIYYLATGTSQTTSSDLSTGGRRVLALSVSLYLAGALFLALLNLEIDQSAKRRALHLVIVGLALFGIIVAFGRGTFIAVAVVVPAILLVAPRARVAVLSLVPLLVPFVLLAAIFVPRLVPDLGTTLADRVSLAGASDFSVQKRQDANALFWAQVEDSPIIGVGFGKKELLTFVGRTTEIEQGFHNSWLFLLAGGGAITVAAFVLVLAVYLRDVWRRIKGAVWPYERVLLIWSVLMLFTLLLNAIAEPLFSFPSVLLTIWLLLFLPGIVPLRERDPVEAEATAELPLWSRPTRFQRLRIASSSRASSSAH